MYVSSCKWVQVSEECEIALKYLVKKNEGFQLPSVFQCSSKILTPKDIWSANESVVKCLNKLSVSKKWAWSVKKMKPQLLLACQPSLNFIHDYLWLNVSEKVSFQLIEMWNRYFSGIRAFSFDITHASVKLLMCSALPCPESIYQHKWFTKGKPIVAILKATFQVGGIFGTVLITGPTKKLCFNMSKRSLCHSSTTNRHLYTSTRNTQPFVFLTTFVDKWQQSSGTCSANTTLSMLQFWLTVLTNSNHSMLQSINPSKMRSEADFRVSMQVK